MAWTRREFLAAAGVAAGAAVLPSLGLTSCTVEGIPLPKPEDSGIDHIIVVMMENRSFDHMLGWLPGADGRPPNRTYTDENGASFPAQHLTTFQGCGFADPDHSYNGGRTQLNNGACDGFLLGRNDTFAIGYYEQGDLPFYGNAVPAWTTFDRYFAATMGPTYPNRLYMHSAQTDRTSNTTATATMPTIWDRVMDAGLTARYYYTDAPLIALYGGKYLPIAKKLPDFMTDCANGTLPNVSFIDPKFLDAGSGTSGDDHPHADIRVGQAFLNSIYEAVSASPQWGSTALFINYDEWGGFADHVAPTTAPDANPNTGLRGFRVPCLAISPRARRGYISHMPYDHTSILKMIEWRWNLASLTPRDAATRNIAEVFDWYHPPKLDAPRWTVPSMTGVACAAPGGDFSEWENLADVADSHGYEVVTS